MSKRMSRASSSRRSFAGSITHERRMSKYRVSDEDLMRYVSAFYSLDWAHGFHCSFVLRVAYVLSYPELCCRGA